MLENNIGPNCQKCAIYCRCKERHSWHLLNDACISRFFFTLSVIFCIIVACSDLSCTDVPLKN